MIFIILLTYRIAINNVSQGKWAIRIRWLSPHFPVESLSSHWFSTWRGATWKRLHLPHCHCCHVAHQLNCAHTQSFESEVGPWNQDNTLTLMVNPVELPPPVKLHHFVQQKNYSEDVFFYIPHLITKWVLLFILTNIINLDRSGKNTLPK